MPVSDLPHQPPEILIRTTNLNLPFKFTTDNFQLLAKVVCFDTARNQMIIEDILSKIGEEGKRLLVLSERKEHLEILAMYLKGKCETIVISGDDSAPNLGFSAKVMVVKGRFHVFRHIRF